MQAKTIFICPTMCGCILEKVANFEISQKALDNIDLFAAGNEDLKQSFVAKLKENGQYDQVTETFNIIKQCQQHASFATPADLWDELRHFHGNAHRPDTCGCSIHFWFDDREPEDVRVQHPIEHPIHTKRCKHHDILDVEEHHDAVVLENQTKNFIVNQIAEDLGIDAADVPFTFDSKRNIVVDEVKLGVSKQTIDAAISKVAVSMSARVNPL